MVKVTRLLVGGIWPKAVNIWWVYHAMYPRVGRHRFLVQIDYDVLIELGDSDIIDMLTRNNRYVDR